MKGKRKEIRTKKKVKDTNPNLKSDFNTKKSKIKIWLFLGCIPVLYYNIF